MSFWTIIYTILIGPLRLLFEVIFSCAYTIIGNPGLTIIVLSLAVNFLILPLYMRADALQKEENDTEARLAPGVAHIKKTFKGDERMMILQTFYRQNNYKPTYVLKGAISLLLEIPFFVAAYSFLSNLPILANASFGPIADLGSPDALLMIGGITINVLPVIMTLLNCISTFIFSKDAPTKTKVQLYCMALLFLVLLYKSPSGLVFYWTLNNLFSLIKTVFYKLKNPRVVSILKKKDRLPKVKTGEPNPGLFTVCGLLLSVLAGLYITTGVIKTSPQEFFDIFSFYNPIWYAVYSLCMAFGLFVVWFTVFYRLGQNKTKVYMEAGISVVCVAAVVDYMFFGKNLGLISAGLQYDNGMFFGKKEMILNLLVIALILVICIILFRKKVTILKSVITVSAIALLAISVVNIVQINKSVKAVVDNTNTDSKEAGFSLSKNGKNVIVIMLDRAMGDYIPYIFSEKPELMDRFSGFTYYENTISYGGHTNFAAPALYGGYEYTPEELNKRDSEFLVDKNNEALKVMPVLFSENGFDVTVCDPTYAGYQEIPDTSIYDEYPDIDVYITKGRYADETLSKQKSDLKSRNFFCYSLTKISPLIFQNTLYDQGNYHNLDVVNVESQKVWYKYQANGFSAEFENAYAVLDNLKNITTVEDGSDNTFLMMSNDTAHEPMLLQKPDYIPAAHVDNREAGDEDRTATAPFEYASNRVLRMDDDQQVTGYHSTMASIIKLGEWFDFLKENGVYDNTRIILVADHGFGIFQMRELQYDSETDMEYFFPMLLVKDFDAGQFSVSDDFMTNADTVSLAASGLIDNPVNPFTGKSLLSGKKSEGIQYIFDSEKHEVSENNGTVFEPDRWFSLEGENAWDLSKWTVVQQNSTLPY